MNLPQRRWLYHLAPPWVGDATYFITICCRERGRDQLCTPDVAAPLMTAMHHYREIQRWFVFLWLLMPDHVHGLIACPREERLVNVVAAWKRHTARHAGILWQKGFFDHRLRHDESFEEKAFYIRMNPVRAGLVAKPEDWPHVWSPSF
jgi:REP element-mobilizing transposase RayT